MQGQCVDEFVQCVVRMVQVQCVYVSVQCVGCSVQMKVCISVFPSVSSVPPLIWPLSGATMSDSENGDSKY